MKFLVILGFLYSVNAQYEDPIIFNKDGLSLPPIPLGARIETVNSSYTSDGVKLYQGDMILTEEQREWLEAPAGMRKAIGDQQYRWPGGVVLFTITPSSYYDRQAISIAMRHWMENTCITFQEVGNNHQAPHLMFQKLEGCYSFVGRMYQQNGQIISIGFGCEDMGTLSHEIGHAIGFHHEQCRPDRDNYVVVLHHNVEQRMIHNFNLERNANTFQIPYDLGSVMHYGTDEFSTNNRNALVTRDPFKHFMIGQRQKLSFADIKLANLMYKCAARCGANHCVNEGFLDQHCRCVCPPGITGDRCQDKRQIPAVSTCGSAINSPTTITSPNFPNNYPVNSKCVWVVTAPAGRRVQAVFSTFKMSERYPDNNWCVWDFLEIRPGDLHDGKKYCGDELERYNYVQSHGNTMVLVFQTRTNYYSGFKADITFV